MNDVVCASNICMYCRMGWPQLTKKLISHLRKIRLKDRYVWGSVLNDVAYQKHLCILPQEKPCAQICMHKGISLALWRIYVFKILFAYGFGR